MKRLRRPKKRSGSNGTKVLFYGAGVIALFLGFLQFEPQSKEPALAVAPIVKAVKAKSIVFEAKAVVASDLTAQEADLNKRRVVLIGEDQIGISGLKLEPNEGMIEIPFEFKPQKQWCQAGDIDTIRYSTDNNFEKNILISIESLADNTRQTFIRVSTEDLYKGVKHSFKLRSFGAGDSVGLFICKSSDGRNSCKNKILISHEKINALVTDPSKSVEAKKADYIYYFQNLVFNESSVNTFSANSYMDKDPSPLIQQLKEQFKLKEKDFQIGWKFSSVLNSLAPRIESGKVVLTLPYNDPKCVSKKEI